MPKKTPKIYKNYSEENLEKAVEAIRLGQMSYRKACDTFGVPKTTVLNRVNGDVVDNGDGIRAGRKTALPQVVENQIVEACIRAAEMGFGISKEQLILKVSRFCKSLNLNVFKNNIPSDDWWRGFHSRHPEISIRKPEPLSTMRSRMMNRVVVSNYFSDLLVLISDNNLTPDVIWNMDETGKQFEHRPTSVVARKGARSIPGRTGNSKENISILACVNAVGDVLPPMCIVKGKTPRCLESFSTLDSPAGTLWTYQERAWMCDILGQMWFSQVFLQNIGPKRPQLLILDSHSSHEVLGLLQEAVRENIIILAMPPHTSHHLQPLDKCVFGPFSRAYDKACTNLLTQHPDLVINKTTWPRVFSTAWIAAFTKDNIVNGFKATGIWPPNPSAIPESAFAPSLAYDTPQDTPSIPFPSSSDLPALPEESCTLVTEPIIPTSTPVSLEDSNSDLNLSLLADAAAIHPEVGADAPDIGIPLPDVLSLLTSLGNGNLVLKEEDPQPSAWDAEVESIFAIPPAESKKSKNVKSKSLTSHRLLTSEEIIESKRMKLAEKERKEKQRAERQMKVKKS
ncbi:uncharacterized protein LOC133203632 [Saccostrea echinata]|uniref:uncharacterized protein LOC133203632 n=1 Tax=Saccostrea echinata TaxID=191078 RepID=UPI002A81D43F|nr:uncharacterized protein LOC133203632 [Saccostrea echinata]